jgi:hypothetical protein
MRVSGGKKRLGQQAGGKEREKDFDALYFESEKLTCSTGSCPEILNRVMLGALRMAFSTRKDMLIRSRT